MDLYRYRVKGRSLTIPGRIIRLTVTARDADDARDMARIKVPDFGTTVESPRRGARVVPDEPDGMEQAKAREFARWRDTDVEVV